MDDFTLITPGDYTGYGQAAKNFVDLMKSFQKERYREDYASLVDAMPESFARHYYRELLWKIDQLNAEPEYQASELVRKFNEGKKQLYRSLAAAMTDYLRRHGGTVGAWPLSRCPIDYIMDGMTYSFDFLECYREYGAPDTPAYQESAGELADLEKRKKSCERDLREYRKNSPGKGALLFYTAAAALCIWNALLSVLSIFVSIEPILGFLEGVYRELPPVVNISLGVLIYLIPAAVNAAGTWMKNLNIVLAIAAVLFAGFGLWGCRLTCRDALGRASEVKEREQEIADIEARLQAVKERMDRLSEENGKYRAICVQWITAWSRWQAFAVKDPTIKAVYQE